MAKRPTSEEIKAAFDEVQTGEDRSVGIIAATMVEVHLEDAIVSRLRPISKSLHDDLFHSFSQKIDLGFALGLYGSKTRADLHFIRRVRNEFAHNLNRDFGHTDIEKLCIFLTDYRTGEPYSQEFLEKVGTLRAYLLARESRYRYIMACLHITVSLLHETRDNSYTPPAPTHLP